MAIKRIQTLQEQIDRTVENLQKKQKELRLAQRNLQRKERLGEKKAYNKKLFEFGLAVSYAMKEQGADIMSMDPETICGLVAKGLLDMAETCDESLLYSVGRDLTEKHRTQPRRYHRNGNSSESEDFEPDSQENGL